MYFFGKNIITRRKNKKIEEERALNTNISSLDELFDKINEGQLAQINIILKTDSMNGKKEEQEKSSF